MPSPVRPDIDFDIDIDDSAPEPDRSLVLPERDSTLEHDRSMESQGARYHRSLASHFTLPSHPVVLTCDASSRLGLTRPGRLRVALSRWNDLQAGTVGPQTQCRVVKRSEGSWRSSKRSPRIGCWGVMGLWHLQAFWDSRDLHLIPLR
ncbi:hypothetical protein PMIN01_00148 [Paraphaeosphaeria minitans]|uniref:Uncharacterized protein n=1 Tax=Paraphaeosphaeria minitans TaxID=565426 RepID=A0A9P6GS89_9PLEO|nr:hypothetical protein PMIN01_00148 [Paraphaeosphaeria minitans]